MNKDWKMKDWMKEGECKVDEQAEGGRNEVDELNGRWMNKCWGMKDRMTGG